MRRSLIYSAAFFVGMGSLAFAQDRSSRRANLEPIGASQLKIGEEGVVWYATWDVAVAEAKRSNRPIFFMSAACQASSVSGVF
ncbi:hypothetical protein ACFPK9_15575 [Rubritalea spongiae]|uniref:Uncharacterized protein n=1 Tax=Rubritalea spongiae TaxID=430797 RepID=A0ABW5DX30_9BACT